MFKSLFKQNKNQSSGVLRVVGDRASGKTTYMAALARWPNAKSSSPVEAVTPSNKDGEYLIKQAQTLLEQGLSLEQTRLVNKVLEIKDYGLKIVFKKEFSNNFRTPLELEISCKDYPGEFFSDLLNQYGSPLREDYLKDCAQATGILLLIDGTAHWRDSQYQKSVEKLLDAFDRIDKKEQKWRKRRIALVLTKCELPELWINRHRPKFLGLARFPQVCEQLEAKQELEAWNVDYFTVSAFGVLGRGEANSTQIRRSKGGVASVLEDPKKWRPFGLVSPIYWLITGKRNQKLDRDWEDGNN